MEKIAGIYCITSPSGKVYVGQSWNVYKRLRQHEIMAKKDCRKLYASLKKHGSKLHTFNLIHSIPDNSTQDYMDLLECEYMNFYSGYGFELLNLKGGGHRGKQSEETKKILSAQHMGKVVSKKSRNKMSRSKKGRPLSKEHGDNVRKALIRLHGYSKNSELKIRVISRALYDGIPANYLTKIFKMSPTLISSIKHGRTWSSITGRTMNNK